MQEVKKLMKILPHVWLQPGELFVSRVPTVVTTILGSCVTVCLFHSKYSAGAMCHCLLPSGVDGNESIYRYVDSTLPRMMQKFQDIGLPLKGMKAKLFGGAVSRIRKTSTSALLVGPANIEMARNVLRKLEIPLVAECVGGHKGYKLHFHSGTGDVYLGRL